MGFTTRFWISTIELFVITNSFEITERHKNQWIEQWFYDIQIIWKLSYINLLRIIVFEFFKHWTMLIIFLFLALVVSIWLTIKPNNFRKFYSWICLSICLCMCPSVMQFSQDLLCFFKNFFGQRYFAIIIQICFHFINHVIFVGFCQACMGMQNLFQNNKDSISVGRVELFCLFVACNCTSMEATVLSCCFS